ncbi:ASCH domain-containing protein [Pseudoalteromonas sp. MM17-2]|uniref:ASCH domain-containing protein n=1 Tax=Pseudoalteromonas sp. MM17-2 TaxID=2917753 RepID=UPI001EF3EF97|nr:ASCH domain-containing protein [Pseudoalteromonas sp. MM17-2]MCG7546161.1 ASCH domain-containing protein [Pseudoalteromonas sp. MM17-2]
MSERANTEVAARAHSSVTELWLRYLDTLVGEPRAQARLQGVWHFCDNEHDANACAQWVLQGRKQATAPSLWELEAAAEPLPQVGDIHIVTNWQGHAQCVIRICAVEVLSFSAVTEAHAALEGEGDGSLAYWRREHQDYYQRVLAGSNKVFTPSMPIVFTSFEVLLRS